MYGINTLPYYTSTSLRSMPNYVGGGSLDGYGRQQYGLGKLVSKITRPIAKVLDKIVPNEIKPALPYIAAFTPMLAGAGFLGTGLSSLSPIQSALLGAGANVIAQSSQEGAAKYGINPLSVGLSALGGYLSSPTASTDLAAGKIAGNLSTAGGAPVPISPEALSNLSGSFDPTFGTSMLEPNQVLAPPTFSQSAENLIRGIGESGADIIGKGTEALKSGNIFSKDFGMAAIGPTVTATGDLAYNRAMKALDEYDQQQKELGAMGVASTEARRSAVKRAMSLAGFTDEETSSALTRLGLKKGGRAKYESGSDKEGVKAIPINLDSIAKQLFNDKLDNLTYTQKETVYNRYYDLKDKKAKGGLMSLGGREMDFRDGGGFVPIGKKERADDVPARLSKNEFVFTAKAVRNAGGGDIRKGAKKMYQLMKQLEAR